MTTSLLLQAWNWFAVLSWPYLPEDIQPLLPAGVVPDVTGGSAWVSLAGLRVEGTRPPFAPALPWVSSMSETHVRTYAVGPDARDGVVFLSMDATRLPVVALSRAVYGIPYHWASGTIEVGRTVRYRTDRRRGDVHTAFEVEVGEEMDPDPLDHWLTGRWGLYSKLAGRTVFVAVEHSPWPLRHARLVGWESSVFKDIGLPEPAGERSCICPPVWRTRG